MSELNFESLIDAYWCLAYKEGEEGRTHDTKNGDAQRVLSDITSYVGQLRQQLAKANKQLEGGFVFSVDVNPAPVVPEAKSISHLIVLELMHNPSSDAGVICDAAAARIVDLLSAAQEKEPLLKPAGHIQTGCYCKPGRCMAPVVMGRQTKCLDPNKAAQEQG